jgi:pyridoxine kinase
MGDVAQGVFVRPDIPAFMRERAVPAADLITPNQFELELLTGTPVRSLADAVAGARKALALGPKVVLVTSLRHDGTKSGDVEMLAVTGQAASRVTTPFLDMDPAPNGAGDALAALFLAFYIKGGRSIEAVSQALGQAAAAIFAVIAETRRAGTRELQLIAAQDQLALPSRRFPVEPVA